MAVDKHIISTWLSQSSPKLAPPLPKVTFPSRGCVAVPSKCVLSWGSEASSRWESVARTCGDPNKELPGFNYAPSPALHCLTDSSLPCCHFGAVEFNLPDGKQINLPIGRS